MPINTPHEINDRIWGIIKLTNTEHQIINTPAFKRLKDIKQMSLAYLEFNGATHNRYEHSIGVMHVAYLMAQELINNCKEEFTKREETGTSNGEIDNSLVHLRGAIQYLSNETNIKALRIAALLHDLGHPPFSHAVEWTFKKNPHLVKYNNNIIMTSHEFYGAKIIQQDANIRRILLDEFKDEKYIEAICALITNDIEFFDNIKNLKIKFLGSFLPILHSDIDADKIDYILRDYQSCGFHSNIDPQDTVKSFRLVAKDINKLKYLLYVKADRTHVVESLLLARLRLITGVHFNPRVRVQNHSLMKSVAKCIETIDFKKRQELIEEIYTEWTDKDLENFIRKTMSKQQDQDQNSIKTSPILEFQCEKIITFPFYEFAPHLRWAIYQISKKPKCIMDLQKNLEKVVNDNLQKDKKIKLFVDICLVDPPPLTIRIENDNHLSTADFIFDYSEIIRGILNESFKRSFVSIYFLNEGIQDRNTLKIYLESILKQTIKQEYSKIREKDVKQISSGDLIITILYAVNKLAEEYLLGLPLWVFSLFRFQQFFFKFVYNKSNSKELILTDNMSLSKYNTIEFSANFYKEIEFLVFCGLIDKRIIEHEYQTENNANLKVKSQYRKRYDFKINGFGKSYYEEFMKVYNKIKREILNVEKKLFLCNTNNLSEHSNKIKTLFDELSKFESSLNEENAIFKNLFLDIAPKRVIKAKKMNYSEARAILNRKIEEKNGIIVVL